MKAWLADLGGDIADMAEGLSESLASAGFSSKRSLRTLKDAKKFSIEFGVPGGLAADIVEEARSEGEVEKRKRLDSAESEIEVEVNRARDELRQQVAAIAISGAEKVLSREIDEAAHRDLLDRLAAEL